MDKSNGYEKIAPLFIKRRGQNANGIGSSSVLKWAKALPRNAVVLDLGCGTGLPITKILIDEGLDVYAIDASNGMINAFLKNFPDIPVACEAAEDSFFFHRKFDAVIAWGLFFLLPAAAQAILVHKIGMALQPGGKLLFTAPYQPVEWKDVMTGQLSISLGADRYRELLSETGLFLNDGFTDEGENYYYNAVKV